MAVYTQLDEDEISKFLKQYDLGDLVAAKGIAEGVENTNYLITTEIADSTKQEDRIYTNYILTLYEKRVRSEDLPFFIGLMRHLASKHIHCPSPILDKNGIALQKLNNRPALITSFLHGICRRNPNKNHCFQLGAELARLHLACLDFTMTRENRLGPKGWQELVQACAPNACNRVQSGLAGLIKDEFNFLNAQWPHLPKDNPELPFGICHADLFPDNVFFIGDTLSGLIDFYFACSDYHAYDLSICLNSWCFERDLSFNLTKASAMIQGYQSVRPLSDQEKHFFPLFTRGSALRFLLTRLYDWINHDSAALVTPHDPLVFARYLRFHQKIKEFSDYCL